MKMNVLPIAAGVFGSLALAVSASGQYLGASIEEIDLGAPEGWVTYRVVAHFGGADLMLAWGALPGQGPALDFHTGNGVFLLNGDGALDGLKFGDFAGFSNQEYDSWLTVGATAIAGNATDYSPGFAGSDGVTALLTNATNSFAEEDGLVFNSNPENPWFGPDVVMAQFTIPGIPGGKPGDPDHNGFFMTGVVGWADAQAGFNVSTFAVDNIIPAPGAMALLGLAGLAGARRRRRR